MGPDWCANTIACLGCWPQSGPIHFPMGPSSHFFPVTSFAGSDATSKKTFFGRGLMFLRTRPIRGTTDLFFFKPRAYFDLRMRVQVEKTRTKTQASSPRGFTIRGRRPRRMRVDAHVYKLLHSLLELALRAPLAPIVAPGMPRRGREESEAASLVIIKRSEGREGHPL